MQVKVDFHTHSVLSCDGGLTISDYTKILSIGILNVVAITDHNEISFAVSLKKRFGERVIVGEEIKTLEGEVIGLFLQHLIPSGLSVQKTIEDIHRQKGIVYIPHPFEKQRDSLQEEAIVKYWNEIDIIEVFNARARGRAMNKSKILLARKKGNPSFASSSDAHCMRGIGTSYSYLSSMPTRSTVSMLLQSATLTKSYAPVISYLCPFVNRLRKKLRVV